MKNDFSSRSFSVSQKIYQRLLFAYPRRHRADYGMAMAQLFRDQSRDAWRESRNWGLLKLWLSVLPDLASTSILERLAALNERKTMNEKIANLSTFRTGPLSVFFTIFALVFFVVLLLSVVITYIQPEAYASTARIKVESDAPAADAQTLAYDPYFIQTTFEIIQSELVLKRVIEKLNLNVQWGKKYFNGETLKTPETVELLKMRLQLAPVKNTKLISITAYSDDKKEAAEVANAVASAYRDYRFESRRMLADVNLKALQEQYQEQEFQIQQAQKELDSLRQKSKDSSDVLAGQAPQNSSYLAKQRDLDYLLDFHKGFFAKIEQEKLDAELPRPTLVQLTDTAEPGRAPVKPNKTLNIAIGAVAGGFLGLVAGAASAFVSFKSGNRGHKDVASA
jgi:capsular polysaccharide biosynthesis protein